MAETSKKSISSSSPLSPAPPSSAKPPKENFVKPESPQSRSEHLRRAAAKGDSHGVDVNYKKAIGWCEKAAEQGLADAQYNLGKLYEAGHGVGIRAIPWRCGALLVA